MDREDNVVAHSLTVTGGRNQTILEGMKANSRYLIEVRAYSSAGYGPPSERLQLHTMKARMLFFKHSLALINRDVSF